MSEQDDAARATEQQQQDSAETRADDQQYQTPPPDQQSETTEGEQSEQSSEDNAESESVEHWKAEAEKWKRAARKAERVNKGEAGRLNEELSQLREREANHDTEAVEAAGALATERLHTKLARAGLSEQDAGALLEHIDPLRLLEDGKPNGKAIDSVASSLTRSLGRAGVDEDQGKRSETAGFSADDWIRRKAKKK